MSPAEVQKACQASPVGKKMHTDLYVHRSAMGELPELLQELVTEAQGHLEDDDDPHPALEFSTRVRLKDGNVQRRDFTGSDNPPILHRKETFVGEDYPRRDEFQALSEAEADAGLLGGSTIGRRKDWEKFLDSRGYAVDGHQLTRTGSLVHLAWAIRALEAPAGSA
jgi:hypothetical protein